MEPESPEEMEPRVCLDCGDILVWTRTPFWAGGHNQGYVWKRSSLCDRNPHGHHVRLRGFSALRPQLDSIIASTGKSNELTQTS